MDEFFFSQELSGDLLWYSQSLPAAKKSDFAPYRDMPRNEIGQENPTDLGNSYNMNKRMIFFLRRSRGSSAHVAKNITVQNYKEEEHERERCFRHMMNERMRRDKQKHGYLALHSMLPIDIKNEKNSIVQTATIQIQQMQRDKERLRRRKLELEAILAENHEKEMMKIRSSGTKIKLKVANPTSGIDSMVEVLNCLKKLGFKARNIRSVFAEEEFSAELEIETKGSAAEIEEALQLTLYEAELRLRSHS